MAYEGELQQIQNYRKQIAEKRQEIAIAQQQVSSYDPSISQTAQQLLKATPLKQVQVRSEEFRRATAKDVAAQQIKEVQQQFESQAKPTEVQLANIESQIFQAQALQRDLDLAKKYAARGQYPVYESKRVKELYNDEEAHINAQQSFIDYNQRLKEVGLQPVFSKGQISGFMDTKTGMSYEASQLPELIQQYRPEDIPKFEQLGLIIRIPSPTPEVSTTIPLVSSSSTDSFLGTNPLYGLTEVKQQLPYQYRGTVGGPTTSYVPTVEPYTLTPLTLAETFTTGVGNIATSAAKAAGVPTLTQTYAVPEIQYFESGTGMYDPFTQQAVIPDKAFLPEQYGGQTVTLTKLSPEMIGKGAEGFATLALYSRPEIAIPLLVTGTSESIKTARQPIPTVSEVIKSQTPELSSVERKAYLETPEGQAYKQDVEKYVESLKRARNVAIGSALLSGGILLTAGALKGVRYAREPILEPFPIPVTRTVPARVGIFTTGEEAAGIKVGGTIRDPWYGLTQKRWEKWLGREPKLVELAPGRIDVVPQVFKIPSEGQAGSVGLTQKFERDTSLKRMFQTLEVQKPIEIVDFSKLPKLPKYIASKLPIRNVGKDVSSYLAIGKTAKGVPVGNSLVRLERLSKAQRQFKILTKPPEYDISRSFIRVQPLQSKALPSDVQLFVSEAATKTSKSLMPRATGEVSTETSLVFVKQLPTPKEAVGTKILGGGKRTKFLTTKQAEELAVRGVQFAPPTPKFKPPKLKASAELEPFVGYPRMVGGLGEETSYFYGFGQVFEAELVKSPPGVLVGPPLEKTQVDLSYGLKGGLREFQAPKPLSSQREKERGKLFFAPTEKTFERESQVPRARLRERERTVQLQPQTTRERQIFRQVLSQPTRTGQPSITFTTPEPPQPPPRTTTTFFPKSIPKRKTPVFSRRGRKGELFYPLLRRYGKWQVVGMPTRFEKALGVAKTQARQTLGASIRVGRVKGGFAKLKAGEEFRFGSRGTDPFTLVQRKTRRLVTPSERAEIKFARIKKVKL